MNASPPRLALVVPSLSKGGGVPSVARFVLNTAIRSNRYKLKVISLSMASADPANQSLLRPSTWLKGPRIERGEWEGHPYFHVGAIAGELEFQRYLPRPALSKLLADCDLIQVVCGTPAWANCVLGRSMPTAIHAATLVKWERVTRDALLSGMLAPWRRAMTDVASRLDERALHRADVVQVMNPTMQAHVDRARQHPRHGLWLAPPGLDSDVFKPKLERNWSVDPYVLCVGRLSDPRKHVDLLLNAYALLPSDVRRRLRVVLAGSSGPPDRFWDRVREGGYGDNVTFVRRPSAEELVRLYQGACMYVSCSYEEGFGMVLVEAMACGVPVIATRSGGPEGILKDGKEGFLTPIGSAEVLAERMRILFSDPAINHQMAQNARSTVESRFSLDAAGRPLLQSWDYLMSL